MRHRAEDSCDARREPVGPPARKARLRPGADRHPAARPGPDARTGGNTRRTRFAAFRRHSRGPMRRWAPRQLGPLEYLLLALILLGIAVTIAMAILDPSG